MQGGGSETRKDELPSFATLVLASSFQIRKMKISERQFGSPSGKRAVRGHVTLYDDVVEDVCFHRTRVDSVAMARMLRAP